MAEALARFPQETMLADRSAALEGIGLTLEEGLRLEARSGLPTLEAAVAGAAPLRLRRGTRRRRSGRLSPNRPPFRRPYPSYRYTSSPRVMSPT